ncbi:hypothetical protein, partial [Methylobacterium radiotolerans]|uniref:hypothetical protein n=1 Tax=Methylobacterium radiotolerans TaxID=31998 RepID=UPI001FD8C088
LGEVVEAPKVRLGAVGRDAAGETVVRIAMMQQGEHASAFVERVKAAITPLLPQLPPGTQLGPYYARPALSALTTSQTRRGGNVCSIHARARGGAG